MPRQCGIVRHEIVAVDGVERTEYEVVFEIIVKALEDEGVQHLGVLHGRDNGFLQYVANAVPRHLASRYA